MADQTLTLLIGPAGSGKTHWRQGLNCTYVVCLDDIREEISGDAGDQSVTPEAVQRSRAMIKPLLRHGHSVIVDETSLVPEYRRDLIAMARSVAPPELHVRAVVFGTSLAVCLHRQLRRPASRQVPEGVVRLQHAALPTWQQLLSDGVDTVEVLRGR